MLVPLRKVNCPPGVDDRISEPGAATSGFNVSEIGAGPADENDETAPAGPVRPVVTEPTAIAEPALAGDPTVPSWKRPYSFPAAATVGTPAAAAPEVALRLDLGLAEREVDHVHAVGHRGLDSRGDLRCVAVQPELVGRHGQDLVVPEVRPRRDAGEPDAGGADRARVAGGDPGDVRRVRGELGVERQAAGGPGQPRGRERARHDHLPARVAELALREARGRRVARAAEEGVRLVDPVVEDRDLHPGARLDARDSPERRRPDHRHAAVEHPAVRRSRVDLGEPRQARQVGRRQ
jgi:hypothetical protein